MYCELLHSAGLPKDKFNSILFCEICKKFKNYCVTQLLFKPLHLNRVIAVLIRKKWLNNFYINFLLSPRNWRSERVCLLIVSNPYFIIPQAGKILRHVFSTPTKRNEELILSKNPINKNTYNFSLENEWILTNL